jgi:hypothetical protein
MGRSLAHWTVIIPRRSITGRLVYAPLIAADPARLESMMPAARDLAKTRNIKMRLIKLTNRVDIEDVMP